MAAKKLPKIQDVLGQLQGVVQRVQSSNVEAIPALVEDLKVTMGRVSAVADALCDDYQTLANELEIQREVTLRLFETRVHNTQGMPHGGWRQLEQDIRAALEKTTDDRPLIPDA